LPQIQTFIYKYSGALHLLLFAIPIYLEIFRQYELSRSNVRQQSCKIFVEIESINITKGAEHRKYLILLIAGFRSYFKKYVNRIACS
jgi:hypothetical protein